MSSKKRYAVAVGTAAAITMIVDPVIGLILVMLALVYWELVNDD